VVRKLIPFVDRLEVWFLVVSDSRIQTGRKNIMVIKKGIARMGYPLKKGRGRMNENMFTAKGFF